jgi:hypothetical protein
MPAEVTMDPNLISAGHIQIGLRIIYHCLSHADGVSPTRLNDSKNLRIRFYLS